MAVLSKQFTFQPETDAASAEVNTNFDDIIAFLNNSVSHLDGSKAYTGWPSLPSDTPGGTLAPTPKSYVDSIPRTIGGRTTVTANGSGEATITHGLGVTPAAVNVNSTTIPGGSVNSGRLANFTISAINSTTFTVKCWDSAAGTALAGVTFDLSWTATEADTSSAWAGGTH